MPGLLESRLQMGIVIVKYLVYSCLYSIVVIKDNNNNSNIHLKEWTNLYKYMCRQENRRRYFCSLRERERVKVK